MSAHPANLALRFLLELAALIVMGYWGWQRDGQGMLRPVLALAVPLIAAVLWGTFRVPGDPGAAPVAVPGLVRLVLEGTFLGFAAWALYDMGQVKLSWTWSMVVIVDHIVSYERVLWIIRQ
jgi:hypothetical protein